MSLLIRIIFFSAVALNPSMLQAVSVTRSVSDGSRIEFKERGFSIVPPKGWNIITSVQGASLLMQPPFSTGMKYQRTLQVSTFQNAKLIDSEDAESFGDSLVEKFGTKNANINGYRIRNFIPVSLKDGNKAMLYYAEFKINGIDLMQSHLLVSSKSRHYVVSFTDLAEHFEGDGETSNFLSTAWETMISFQVDEKPGMQLTPAMKAGIATGVSILLIGFFALLRFRRDRATRKYDQMAVDLERTTGDHASSTSDLSNSHPVTRTAAFAGTQWKSGETDSEENDIDFDDEQAG